MASDEAARARKKVNCLIIIFVLVGDDARAFLCHRRAPKIQQHHHVSPSDDFHVSGASKTRKLRS